MRHSSFDHNIHVTYCRLYTHDDMAGKLSLMQTLLSYGVVRQHWAVSPQAERRVPVN